MDRTCRGRRFPNRFSHGATATTASGGNELGCRVCRTEIYWEGDIGARIQDPGGSLLTTRYSLLLLLELELATRTELWSGFGRLAIRDGGEQACDVAFSDLDFRSTNSLWCSVLVETLVRCGLRRVVLSPGSRSTPLTLAFAQHSALEAIPVLDERSAAFFALGLSKAQGIPVALVCTSGTAGANYLPALIEAREAGVPLLVFTADRPPELRASSAGQTIDQQKLFGSYSVFHHEYAVPELSVPLLRYLRQMTAQAWSRCQNPIAGPVHLNCPFRDPLHPVPEEGLADFRETLQEDSFWTHLPIPPSAPPALASWPLPDTERGLIIAGPSLHQDSVEAEVVGEIARRLGWPVLADALSPLRHHPSAAPALISAYDCLLRSTSLAESLCPEAILVIGALPTSKVLRGWLASLPNTPMLVLSEAPESRDATHSCSLQIRASLESVAALLPDAAPAPSDYVQRWRQAESGALQSLDRVLSSTTESIEPKAVWLLSRHLQEQCSLFVANSMPVRDLEYLWTPGCRRCRVFFNRGANGIDGTLSTALGVAHAGRPSVLLTGDLSLLHDTNGFLLTPRLQGSLTAVLINNDGGGIFEHLPVSGLKEHFETFFATPQQVSFAELARAYAVKHTLVSDWTQFTKLISNLPRTGVQILELRTDRKNDAALRKRLFAEAASCAESEAFGAKP